MGPRVESICREHFSRRVPDLPRATHGGQANPALVRGRSGGLDRVLDVLPMHPLSWLRVRARPGVLDPSGLPVEDPRTCLGRRTAASAGPARRGLEARPPGRPQPVDSLDARGQRRASLHRARGHRSPTPGVVQPRLPGSVSVSALCGVQCGLARGTPRLSHSYRTAVVFGNHRRTLGLGLRGDRGGHPGLRPGLASTGEAGWRRGRLRGL